MATVIYLHRFPVDDIQTLSLEHMSPGATTMSGSTFCHGNLVVMATKKHFYNSGICRSMNFMLGRHISFKAISLNCLVVNTEML